MLKKSMVCSDRPDPTIEYKQGDNGLVALTTTKKFGLVMAPHAGSTRQYEVHVTGLTLEGRPDSGQIIDTSIIDLSSPDDLGEAVDMYRSRLDATGRPDIFKDEQSAARRSAKRYLDAL